MLFLMQSRKNADVVIAKCCLRLVKWALVLNIVVESVTNYGWLVLRRTQFDLLGIRRTPAA